MIISAEIAAAWGITVSAPVKDADPVALDVIEIDTNKKTVKHKALVAVKDAEPVEQEVVDPLDHFTVVGLDVFLLIHGF